MSHSSADTLLHAGRIFDLIARHSVLPSGLEQTIDVIVHPGAVGVAALEADGRLLLVRQYRPALEAWTLEIPAGRLEAGEDPLDAARRELEEETGRRAGSWSTLRPIVPAPGFCNEVVHLFEARDLVEVPGGGLEADPDEEIEVLQRTPREILASGEADAKTLIAALLLERRNG